MICYILQHKKCGLQWKWRVLQYSYQDRFNEFNKNSIHRKRLNFLSTIRDDVVTLRRREPISLSIQLKWKLAHTYAREDLEKTTRFLFPSRPCPLIFSSIVPSMHYESEITLEYPTRTYECIKGAGGDMDSLSIFQYSRAVWFSW